MVRIGLPSDFNSIELFDPFAGDRLEELTQGWVLVAEVSGQVVGYTTFSNPGFIGHPFVNFVAVKSDYRRRGIARALLHVVEEKIKSGRLFASTEEDNARIAALFQRERWTFAGSVQGVNDDGLAECFYYRDIKNPLE